MVITQRLSKNKGSSSTEYHFWSTHWGMATGSTEPEPWPAMPKREFSVALQIRLGIPIFPNSKRCPCGNTVDKFGDHLQGCNQGQSSTTKCHDALCEVVYNALLTDDSRCRRKARCSSSNQTRP